MVYSLCPSSNVLGGPWTFTMACVRIVFLIRGAQSLMVSRGLLMVKCLYGLKYLVNLNFLSDETP